MKVVINKCYGGFGISPVAAARLAELKGRACFFFKKPMTPGKLLTGEFVPVSIEDADGEFIWWAFDIPNPNDVLMREDNWHEMTMEQKEASSALYKKHHIDSRPSPRHDPDLVRVVEELGERASGRHGKLVVVEIPDGVEYVIDEYDGLEHIAEAHRTWG